MIVGVGIDVVEIDRFAQKLADTPGMRDRLFTPSERDLPIRSLAARFAAKEALSKALGAPPGMSWQDAEVDKNSDGQPYFRTGGTVQARMSALDVDALHLSLTHDGGIASAVCIAEG